MLIHIHIGKEANDNDPKFKAGDHIRISKYKNIFAILFNGLFSLRLYSKLV